MIKEDDIFQRHVLVSVLGWRREEKEKLMLKSFPEKRWKSWRLEVNMTEELIP